MTVPHETLMAFVDGELADDDMRRVGDQIARDPELLRYVEQQKALKTALAAAFAPVLVEPIPPVLERAVRETPVSGRMTPSGFGLLKRLRELWEVQSPATRLSWVPAGTMAAGVALGVLLAGSFGNTGMQELSGGLLAQGDLARVLSARLAGDQTGDEISRVGVSFFSKDGFFCRSFITGSGRNRLSGIACREGNDWRIAAVASAPVGPTGAFSTAGADMPASIRSTLNEMIASGPLDAAAELAAKNQGWQAR
jgi:hypothetical protein